VTVAEARPPPSSSNRSRRKSSLGQIKGELSLSLRSIAENDGKGLDGGGPKLAGDYGTGKKKKGKTAGDLLYVRYGIESVLSTR
jgi:hypothetical protein